MGPGEQITHALHGVKFLERKGYVPILARSCGGGKFVPKTDEVCFEGRIRAVAQ